MVYVSILHLESEKSNIFVAKVKLLQYYKFYTFFCEDRTVFSDFVISESHRNTLDPILITSPVFKFFGDVISLLLTNIGYEDNFFIFT